MALLLKQAYERKNPAAARVVRPDAGGSAGAGGEGTMTEDQYVAEVRKIRAKVRGPVDASPEYQALRTRFLQSRP